MGWYYTRTITDDGYRNTVVSKHDLEAVISYKARKIFLLGPKTDRAFEDFVELEEWLSRSQQDPWSPPVEEVNYHVTLDEMVSRCIQFLTDKSIYDANKEHNAPVSFHCEALVYLAAFRGWRLSGIEIHIPEWNSFKTSVENRMLAILDDGSIRSGVSTSGGAMTFTSYTSSYWNYLTQREKLDAIPDSQGSRVSPLIDQLLNDMDGSESTGEALQTFFDGLARSASRDLIASVARAFR